MRHCLLVPLALAAVTAAPSVHAADPSVTDCLSATEAAPKLRASHKLREARKQLLVCAAPTCPAEIRADCTHAVDEVNANLSTIVFAVKTTAGQELSAVKVTMDGEVVAEQLDGSALALDPGSHSFTFESAGQPQTTQTFILREGDKWRIESVVMGSAATAAAATATATPTPTPSSTQASSPGGPLKTVGIVTGAVGVAGLAFGTVFGVLALSTKGSDCSNGLCNPGSSSTAYTRGNMSTAGFIAGGVLLAGGVTMFLLAPKGGSEKPAASVAVGPMAGPSVGGLQLAGRW